VNRVFADTSFYIALVRPDDENHQGSLEFDRQFSGQYLTSEFVLIELGNWLADPRNRGVFLEIARVLRSDPRTAILAATSEWVTRGLALYGQRLDKHWSLIDCVSFEMMRDHGVTDALTTDHHFIQAGFHALLATSGK
jgi:predicted nucleic acid-binding protein